jgi:hypothetical protein
VYNISNRYGSLTRNFKFTFADWLKFSLIEEFTYEIDVW